MVPCKQTLLFKGRARLRGAVFQSVFASALKVDFLISVNLERLMSFPENI